MNKRKRTERIELMENLYQYDLYNSANLAFIPRFEIEENENVFFKIVDKLDHIDDIIENNLYHYSLYRLNFVDRAIVRLATYELLYTDLAKQIIINEAVELTKTYTNLDDEGQRKFNNKLMDQIAKAIRG